MKGKVYFIGAGPGDPELITLRAINILKKADVIIYAGSLVPESLIKKYAKPDSEILNSAHLDLNEIHSLMVDAVRQLKLVARVHTGDPSLYGAIHEQAYLLEKDKIEYEIIPGISAAFATACKAKVSFTLPEVAQSLIITRLEGRTKMPEKEKFEQMATHLCPMAIYLSASKAEDISKICISAGYDESTCVIIGYRVGWEDEKIIYTNLKELPETVKKYSINRQAIFLILPNRDQIFFSKLYDPEFSHGYRK
jgi:precorrin-4/cobalt-precorrin-4 C11-methyltransferase